MDEKEFAVFKDHLKTAGEVLQKSAEDYRTHVPNGGHFIRSSGGDPQLDKVLDVTLGTIEEMHTILVQALGQHGSKLLDMFRRYKEADGSNVISVAAVLEDMMAPPDAPPPLQEPPSFGPHSS